MYVNLSETNVALFINVNNLIFITIYLLLNAVSLAINDKPSRA